MLVMHADEQRSSHPCCQLWQEGCECIHRKPRGCVSSKRSAPSHPSVRLAWQINLRSLSQLITLALVTPCLVLTKSCCMLIWKPTRPAVPPSLALCRLAAAEKKKEKVYAVRRVWEASDRPRRPFVAPWEQKDVEPHSIPMVVQSQHR